jgi:hypothetical protein
MNPHNGNVTFIDDLPELTDVDMRQQPQHLPPQEMEKYQKYIRHEHVVPEGAGMHSYITPPQQEFFQHEPVMQKTVMPDNSPSCIQVADHIHNCPICSKFYKNDRTIYIIAIVILMFICVLLLKKVLDI